MVTRSVVLLAAAAACLALPVSASLHKLPLDGSNATGSVSFEGSPWVASFTPTEYQRLSINPYVLGSGSDKLVRLYVGVGYIPSGARDNADWWGDALEETTGYDPWSPAIVDIIALNTPYYVAVYDDLLPSASFTVNVESLPLPAPKVTTLEVGDEPLPGKVNRGQYTLYTFSVSSEGNATATVQFSSGFGAVLVNPTSVATYGGAQWRAVVDTKKSNTATLHCPYLRTGTTYSLTVWGGRGTLHDDDDSQEVDKFYVSVRMDGSN